MKDKSLIVKKDTLFNKIIEKIRNFFWKNKNNSNNSVNNIPDENIGKGRKEFLQTVEFKENMEDLELINHVRNNLDLIYKMNNDELKKLSEAIDSRQKYIDKKISILKMNIMMEKKSSEENNA